MLSKRIGPLVALLSLVFFVFLFCYLLPFIYQAGLEGILFIVTVFLFFINLLYQQFKKPKIMGNMFVYYLAIMMITLYLLIIVIKINEEYKFTGYYSLDPTYFKCNFLILTIVLLILIVNYNILTLKRKK